MKEQPNYTPALIQSEAKRLHTEGVPKYQIVTRLAKVYGSEAVSKWLELETLLRRENAKSQNKQ